MHVATFLQGRVSFRHGRASAGIYLRPAADCETQLFQPQPTQALVLDEAIAGVAVPTKIGT